MDKAMVLTTKRVAEKFARELHATEGGLWAVEQVGRQWRAYCAVTKKELDRSNTIKHAEAALKRDFFGEHFGIFSEKRAAEEKLAKFRIRLETDPFNAFEWGNEAVQAAADLKVIAGILYLRDHSRDLNQICESLEYDLRCADEGESLSQSTSPMSTLAARAQRIALRKYVKQIRSFLQYRACAIGDLYAAAEEASE